MKNLIKITTSVLLTVCLLAGFILVPITASAAPAIQLTLTDAKGASGQDITVSLNISESSNLAAFDFIIKYDSTKLLYKSNKLGEAASEALFSINPNYKLADESEALKGSFVHVDGITDAGSLLDFTFTVAPGWSGTTSVSLEVEGELSDSTYNSIPFETKNATVTADDTGSSVTAVVDEKDESKTLAQVLTVILVIIVMLILGVVLILIIVKKNKKISKKSDN